MFWYYSAGEPDLQSLMGARLAVLKPHLLSLGGQVQQCRSHHLHGPALMTRVTGIVFTIVNCCQPCHHCHRCHFCHCWSLSTWSPLSSLSSLSTLPPLPPLSLLLTLSPLSPFSPLSSLSPVWPQWGGDNHLPAQEDEGRGPSRWPVWDSLPGEKNFTKREAVNAILNT